MKTIFTSSRNGLILSGYIGMDNQLPEYFNSLDRELPRNKKGNCPLVNCYHFIHLQYFLQHPIQALIGANKPMQDALIAADRFLKSSTWNQKKRSQKYKYLKTFRKGILFLTMFSSVIAPGVPVFNGIHLRFSSKSNDSGRG